MNKLTLVFLTLALGGCTFNASWLDRRIEADGVPGSFDALLIDATEAGGALDGTTLRVVGTDVADSALSAHLAGLVGVRDDVEAITRSVSVDWTRLDETTIGVDVVTMPRLPQHVWIDELRADLPAERDVFLEAESGSIEIEGIRGRVDAHSSSGSIVVSGAGIVDLSASSGSIRVAADAGHAHVMSGSIELELAGWVDASADDGSIAGHIGGGGTIRASDGSIDVELTQPLDRDLELTTMDGSIVLSVPRGSSMALDVASENGSVRVDVGDVQYGGHELVAVARDGGFTVHARAGNGSIVIRER